MPRTSFSHGTDPANGLPPTGAVVTDIEASRMQDQATLNILDGADVRKALAGDQAAFAALYERYFNRVYDFLARMLRDSAAAEDVTQETFIQAMTALPSL